MKKLVFLQAALLAACGSLNQANLINPGDDAKRVVSVMGGPPDDRQTKGRNEAWQWCQTGAGFGYNDHKIVWFVDGRVTGVSSYKTGGPGPACSGRIRQVSWEDAPTATLEIRQR